MKHCLICFEDIYHKVSLYNYFSYDDVICEMCRSKMNVLNEWKKVDNLDVFCLYEYDSFMESLLFQFKEGRDIALKDVFFYKHRAFIEKKFKGYTIVYMPSSREHTNFRNFFPLEEMLSLISLPKQHCLKKTKEYKQSSQSFEKRKEIKKVMKLKDEIHEFPEKILLVDDVMTSGETLLSAYSLLQEKCQDVKALVLCDNHRDVELCDENKFPFFDIIDILKKEVRTWWKDR